MCQIRFKRANGPTRGLVVVGEGFVCLDFRSNVDTVRSPNGSNPSSTRAGARDDVYLSVAEVARGINDLFEQHLAQILFRGEISQLTVAQSGHVYFTVKDENAQLSCVVWSGVARTLPFKLQVGMVVRCHGRPNVYPPSGRMQVVVHRLMEDGEGALQRKFLELKAQLDREGLFAQERKRQIPFLPKAVGIVTSKTGAVIHDMMVKIRERFPAMPVYLADTRVQGEGAAEEIVEALRALERSGLVDVIIVARGGGSLEDLWAFNEEVLVRAVFACSLPVVSGVGHEVDTTLCDLAADVRAPTPTAAAEMVVPKVSDLLVRVAELERRLSDSDRWLQPKVQRIDELCLRFDARINAVVHQARLRLKAAEATLAVIRPDRVLELVRSRVDAFQQRLLRSSGQEIAACKLALSTLAMRLQRALPPEGVARLQVEVETLAERLHGAAGRVFESHKQRVEHGAARLAALSPERVLERGYSIVRSGGAHLRSAGDAAQGAEVEIALADGTIFSTVTKHTKEITWRNLRVKK
jgi:exodeoxyribonuclease VII large subunit